jgi:hypothetical protein
MKFVSLLLPFRLRINVIKHSLQDDNYTKIIEPVGASSTGFLYFGHTGNHYVALKKYDALHKATRIGKSYTLAKT